VAEGDSVSADGGAAGPSLDVDPASTAAEDCVVSDVDLVLGQSFDHDAAALEVG